MYGVMIQKLRKENRYSQKNLSDHLGIGVSTISMWESEKREPDYAHLMAIAELFHVSVDYILYGKVDEVKLTHEEQDVLTLFRQLPVEHQFEIKGIMKGILLRNGGASL